MTWKHNIGHRCVWVCVCGCVCVCVSPRPLTVGTGSLTEILIPADSCHLCVQVYLQSLVIPADNCQLVALTSQRSVLMSAGAHPVLSVVRTQAVARGSCSETSERTSCLPSLCWGRCLQGLAVSQLCCQYLAACILEQSTLKSESTQHPGVRGIKQLGVEGNELVILSRDHCYTLPTCLEESGQYRLFCW